MRFGVDARGYGFVVFLVILLLGILGRATSTGRWRWWVLYGLAQFYLLWTYPGAIHVPASMNVAALWLIWTDQIKSDRPAQLGRWLAANLLTALLVIGIMAPLLVPFLEFVHAHKLSGSLDLSWFKDAACYAACGAPWLTWSSTNPLSTAVGIHGLPSALDILLLTAPPGHWPFSGSGSSEKTAPSAVSSLSGRRPTAFARSSHRQPHPPLPLVSHPFHARPSLPLGSGPDLAVGSSARRLAIAGGVILVVGIHTMSWPQSRLLGQHPIEANRESVALTRHVTNPRHPDYGKNEITAGSIMTPGCYDPGEILFTSVEELQQLIARATLEKKPLYVNFGFRELYQFEHADLLSQFG